jgi:hypothetical protein
MNDKKYVTITIDTNNDYVPVIIFINNISAIKIDNYNTYDAFNDLVIYTNSETFYYRAFCQKFKDNLSSTQSFLDSMVN